MGMKKLHEIAISDDIRYRGPISYQGFQVLGWICMIAPLVNVILALSFSTDPQKLENSQALFLILSNLAPFALPFLLIANFARILNNNEGYQKQLLRNGLAALAIFASTTLLFSRYVVGLLGQAVKQPEQVEPLMEELFSKYNGNGFVAFNVFIDLFICTLTMFFLNAHPERIFTGRKIIILRLFVILPIAYEVASIWLKIQAALGNIILPFWSFPLLTVKPPMTFALFLFLSIHMRGREIRFRRHGRTHKDYLDYLKTRRNSSHFSVSLAISMVVATILDFILLRLILAIMGMNEQSDQAIRVIMALKAAGFSKSWPLFFVAPLLLLFSYNRVPKLPIISMLTPLIAIMIILLLVLEMIFQVAGALVPTDMKLDINLIRFMLPQIMPQIRQILGL